MRLVIGISGASGAPYARRLIEQLRDDDRVSALDLVLSRSAPDVWRQECDGDPTELGLTTYSGRDYNAPFASGSNAYDAMVVIPASMSAVARIAHGISDDLLTRTADVMLKERRQLILVPRETPYSPVHLENMLKVSRLGALVAPASPSFYHRPTTLEAAMDTVLSRVRDHLGLPAANAPRWEGETPPPRSAQTPGGARPASAGRAAQVTRAAQASQEET